MSSRKALVQVFGKGFRVSSDSEEFQRLVPKDSSDLKVGLERSLQEYKGWPALLDALYKSKQRDALSQFCVLISGDEILAIAGAPTEDVHGRPSAVFVTANVDIGWEDDDLPGTFEQCAGLASRLTLEYADVFARNPARLAGQLSKGTFLRDRRLDLANEKSGASLEWPQLVQAIRDWQGINGVATPRLSALGANVVIGTRHEAEKANVRGGVDGYYDVREQRIVALTDRIKPWVRVASLQTAKQTELMRESEGDERLESIDASLKSIDGSVRRVADAVEGVVHALFNIWLPGTRSDDDDERKR